MAADMLATPEDLASLLERDDLDAYKATMLIEIATAVVQGVTGQRIIEATSTVTLEGDGGRWLWLPQIPARSVTSVTVDGSALDASGYQLRGHRLWRDVGWMLGSQVGVEYVHGYAAGDQGLQPARQAVLSLAAAAYGNPSGVTQERIDDYAVSYEAMAARMEASPYLRRALVSQYGRSVGLVTLGG